MHSRRARALLPASLAARLRYPVAAMAVPKQKQSHARTAKRRAQHKMAAPTYNACPHCHSPRLPHRVCPTCGTYAGREVVAGTAHDHDHDH
jgi:large subunit ribosomal protein L32